MMKYGVLTTGLLMAAACFTAHASTQASQVTAKASSQYAKTKYPIVFSHGMAGFIQVGTDQFGLDYWYQILPDLARNGANVWATRVSPLTHLKFAVNNFWSRLRKLPQLPEQIKLT